MKVILVNGSPHEHGTTAYALDLVKDELHRQGIETEDFFVNNSAIQDCMGCGKCAETGKCIFDDEVNVFIERAKKADGFIFGSPVYYSHPTGKLLSFMDRAFFAGKSAFVFKPAAAVLAARRAGSTDSMDILNKYFSICSMPIVSSTYWNHVFGSNAKQAEEDAEGRATMHNLASSMAWMLKCLEAGRKEGILPPELERAKTNFIR